MPTPSPSVTGKARARREKKVFNNHFCFDGRSHLTLRTSKVAPSLVRRLIARRRFTVELIRLQEGKVSDETVGHTVVMWSPFTFRVGC